MDNKTDPPQCHYLRTRSITRPVAEKCWDTVYVDLVQPILNGRSARALKLKIHGYIKFNDLDIFIDFLELNSMI